MSSLEVELLSPAKILAQKTVTEIRIPGLNGEFDVLPGHADLVSEIDIGILSLYQDGNRTDSFFVSGGYVEVSENKVRVLVDVAEKASDIDAARAEDARKRAKERLDAKAEKVDFVRAQAALKRAVTRITFTGS